MVFSANCPAAPLLIDIKGGGSVPLTCTNGVVGYPHAIRIVAILVDHLGIRHDNTA